jgi:hypothetical protein
MILKWRLYKKVEEGKGGKERKLRDKEDGSMLHIYI